MFTKKLKFYRPPLLGQKFTWVILATLVLLRPFSHMLDYNSYSVNLDG